MSLRVRLSAWLSRLGRRVRPGRWRPGDDEIDAEVRGNLAWLEDEAIARGLSPAQAGRAARLALGGVEPVKEAMRDVRAGVQLERLARDVRYGIRLLARAPGFTAAAVLTLALGIGVNTAIFSVIHAILLRPLAYTDPARLVVLHETFADGGSGLVPWLNFVDWRARNTVFTDMAGTAPTSVAISGEGGAATRHESLVVSASYFGILGVRPLLGRTFTADEDRPGAAQVAVITEGLWRSRFAANPAVVGRSVTLNARPHLIVGVVPSDRDWARQADVFMPIAAGANSRAFQNRRNHLVVDVLARLKPEVTLEHASAEMTGIARQLKREHPEINARDARVMPLHERLVGETRHTLMILLGAVAFVLLVACANVSNLLLARAATREREIAVRLALGASRGRIVQQLLVESVLLSGVGGAAGLALAVGTLRGLKALAPASYPRLESAHLDGMVLAFTFAIALAAGLLFGLAPALRAGRIPLTRGLLQGGRAYSASSGGVRQALVAAEVALSLMLLCGAGLMLQTVYRLLHVEAGFRAEGVLSMRVSLPEIREDPEVVLFFGRVVERLRALPGVRTAGGALSLPLDGGSWVSAFSVEGHVPRQGEPAMAGEVNPVTHDYFSALGITLRAGRAFTAADRAGTAEVAIVNDTLTRRFWPGESALGKRVRLGPPDSDSAWATIVGVVGDVKQHGLASRTRMEIFRPHPQEVTRTLSLALRTAGMPPALLIPAVREAIAGVDPDTPIYTVQTMEEATLASVGARRLTMWLLGLFAALALTLAMIGIVGTTACWVAERWREIAIRMAVGASPAAVLRLVLVQGMRAVVAGALAGLAGAALVTRLMASLLYGVTPYDLLTLTGAATLLLAVSLVACYLPARRAARVDPLVALQW